MNVRSGLSLWLMACASCTSYHAGYRWDPFTKEISGPIRSFHFWFPTDFPEKSYAYDARHSGSAAVDAPVLETKKPNPLILVSQERRAPAVAIARLAEPLARRGFVIAAVDPAAEDRDREEGAGADPQQAVRDRLLDLFKLYDHLKETGERYQVDLERLGLLGMGDGSLTMLLAIGVRIQGDPLLVGADPALRRFANSMRGFVWPEKRLFPVKAAALIRPFGSGLAYPLGDPLPILLITDPTDPAIPMETNAALFKQRFEAGAWPVEVETRPNDAVEAQASSLAAFFARRLAL